MISPSVKKLRRIAKHLAAKHPELLPKLVEANKGPSPDGLGRIVLQHIPSMRNIFGIKPLVWLAGKAYAQHFGDNKNKPSRVPEHVEALKLNAEVTDALPNA